VIAVDASALCAIFLDEPEREAIVEALGRAGGGWMTAVNFWEASVTVSERHRLEAASVAMGDLIESLNIRIEPIGKAEAALAFEAWRRFGKRRHKAALNLGDCFAYALARAKDAPLLYKGADFPQTDIQAAL
jgi:ribonuclease VapC